MRRVACTLLIALSAVSVDAMATLPSLQESCSAQALQMLLMPSVLDELQALTTRASPARDAEQAPSREADPRRLLVNFAMSLRDIHYRRGGRSPHSGFDCSGFVHYVFAQVLGVELPENSAAQFAGSQKIGRDELQAGDLVFFRTRGKRVSHVGIYLGAGRFIHSPTTGERVRVDRLSEQYWARRFAGARRPDALI